MFTMQERYLFSSTFIFELFFIKTSKSIPFSSIYAFANSTAFSTVLLKSYILGELLFIDFKSIRFVPIICNDFCMQFMAFSIELFWMPSFSRFLFIICEYISQIDKWFRISWDTNLIWFVISFVSILLVIFVLKNKGFCFVQNPCYYIA